MADGGNFETPSLKRPFEELQNTDVADQNLPGKTDEGHIFQPPKRCKESPKNGEKLRCSGSDTVNGSAKFAVRYQQSDMPEHSLDRLESREGDCLDNDNRPVEHTAEPSLVTASAEDQQTDDSDDCGSEMSDLFDLNMEGWRPIAGPISWVHRQMLAGVDPRQMLRQLITDDTVIPEDIDDLTLWKIILNIVSEPPRRKKLPDINTLEDVIQLLHKSKKVMVLTGAGVSVSCGIPDFRSRDGIYARLAEEYPDLPDPQAMFSIEYFRGNPKPFFKFAKEIYPGQFIPSRSHKFIRLIQDHGRLLRNYTQNIDTLEQEAGITKVIQCHGSFATATCMVCKYKVDAEMIRDDIMNQVIPKCPRCPDEEQLAILKPDIVFFGESLAEEFHCQMDQDKDQCDLLIVIGSSLKVRPVALIPNSLPHNVPQVLINREPLRHLNFDVELLGDCDGIINELCQRMGEDWQSICTLKQPSKQIGRGELLTPPLAERTADHRSSDLTETTVSIKDSKTETPGDHCTVSPLSTNESISSVVPSTTPEINSKSENQLNSSCPLEVNVERCNRSSIAENDDKKLQSEHGCPSSLSVEGDGNDTCGELPLNTSTSSPESKALNVHPTPINEIGSHSNDSLQNSATDVAVSSTETPNTLKAASEPTNGSLSQLEITKSNEQSTGSKTIDQLDKEQTSTSQVGQSSGCENDGIPYCDNQCDKELRDYWQPRFTNFASSLEENTFLFLPPNRYIFKGAEVWYDVDDETTDDSKDSSSDSDQDDYGDKQEETKPPQPTNCSTSTEGDPSNQTPSENATHPEPNKEISSFEKESPCDISTPETVEQFSDSTDNSCSAER